jgi:hypothetical protein
MRARNVLIGAYAGLTGGVVSGSLMGINNTLQMFGQTTLTRSTGIDFVIHMGISVSIGVSFVLLFPRGFRSLFGGLIRGVAYGGLWWFLGPLTLLPLVVGGPLGSNWHPDVMVRLLPSLGGHLVCGAVLGGFSAALTRAARWRERPTGERRPGDRRA